MYGISGASGKQHHCAGMRNNKHNYILFRSTLLLVVRNDFHQTKDSTSAARSLTGTVTRLAEV